MLTFPSTFIARTQILLPTEWDAFEQALQQEAPVSIRLNNKITPDLPFSKVPWCENSYYLPERPLFTADPLFHAGAYYVQEAGSMFLEQVIKQHINQPVRALDLCAAPGGKSTHLSNLLPHGSFLISNETIRQRAYILAENMQKWGNPDVAVTCNSAADFGKLKSSLDLILADVPCSGEGMFRKDPASITEWSPANVELCAVRQREIISDVWPALKEGGILIYSTCTYNRSEDEENIEWIENNLGAEHLSVQTNPEWQVTESSSGYRFYPHKTQSEGFFISILQKTASADYSSSKRQKNSASKTKTTKFKADAFASYLINDEWAYNSHQEKIYACHKSFEEWVSAINTHLSPLFTGIVLGEQKGHDFIPNTALALSKALNQDQVNTSEIDWETAIAFLKREAITLPEASRGYILLTYNNLPLGWVKNLGNRANNLYPSEWRIRMNLDTRIVQKSPLQNNNL